MNEGGEWGEKECCNTITARNYKILFPLARNRVLGSCNQTRFIYLFRLKFV